MNVLNLLANLRLYKVTKWDEDSSVTYSREEREPATSITEANVSTSIREDADDSHALLIDLDVPAWLVKVAKKLRVTWDAPVISSSVRGSKRAQISKWLLPR